MRHFRSLRSRARHLRAAAFTAALLLLLLTAPALFAGWITVNTNNNAADDFGPPVYTSNCGNGSIADQFEIKNGWIAYNGTDIAFKLEACGTASSYSNVRYAGGLDCTRDGDVNDADGATLGDRRVVYQPQSGSAGDKVTVVDGANNTMFEVQDVNYGERIGSTAIFEWKAPLQYIPPDCRASVFTIGMGHGTAEIVTGRAQTRDQSPLNQRAIPIDYGDANNPNPNAQPPTCAEYPTRLACDGARHGTEGALKLGALVDPDNGGLYNVNADGDDLANLADEDGVFPTEGVNWVKGAQGSLTATVTGGSGYLNCWIDWNNDKDWADAGEKVVDNSAVAAGASTRAFTVSNSAANFPTAFIARCRLSPGSGQGSAVTGPVEFGEVEDHRWAFGSSGNRPAAPTLAASLPNPTTLRLSWTNIAANEGYFILSSAAPYFKPGDAGVTTVADPDNSSPYDVAGVAGAPADARFYAAQGQVTSSDPDLTSGLSNRVGLFEFALVKGS
jgi:hypothetical protein